MKRRALTLHLVMAACVAVLVPALTAHATVAIALSRAQLVSRAELIVRATVGEQRSTWNETHTQIITFTTLHVSRVWKGQSQPVLVLRQFGGSVDGLTSRVNGDATFRQGEDAVFFLRQGAGVVYLTALAQSVYVVNQQGAVPTVERDLHGLAFTTLQSGGPTQIVEPAPESYETLAHLVADIAQLLEGAR